MCQMKLTEQLKITTTNILYTGNALAHRSSRSNLSGGGGLIIIDGAGGGGRGEKRRRRPIEEQREMGTGVHASVLGEGASLRRQRRPGMGSRGLGVGGG
jgi:hypothetical protein